MSDVGAAFRLLRAGWIMVREGVVAALPGDQLSGLPHLGWRLARLLTRRSAIRRGRSDRLATALTRLGPSYVKLGQFLATRPDVVGNDMALDLALLQDRMETFPRVAGNRGHRGLARASARRTLHRLRRTGRRRVHCPGPSSRGRPGRKQRQGRRQGDPARCPPGLLPRPRKLLPRGPPAGAVHPRDAPAAAG